MNLKELTWPVRIYWDLPREAADAARLQAIAREILELKVLFLSLRDDVVPVSPSCFSLVDSFAGKNIALALTVAGEALSARVLERASAGAVRTVLANVTSLEAMRRIADQGLFSAARRPGISFDITSGNYREIPEVVSFCLEHAVTDLVFPIQRLSGKEAPFCFTDKERSELAPRLSALAYRSLKLTIHDPFLWPLFYPEKDYHEGGCQAANSMLFIAPDLAVTPCPAMPMILGNLGDTSLREIVLSDAKKELRRILQEPPDACSACKHARVCLGGCRGRALAATRSLIERDPACR
ncbi:MAG: SPASM domain-containing protein [Nitrospiraceae bacterium]|nr:SPASM domain-containing protein [Nitrospiraceae bacterium]